MQVIDPVCHQLFDFYWSLNTELQRFTLELVPTLLWTYMSSPCISEKKVIFCSLIYLITTFILTTSFQNNVGQLLPGCRTIPEFAIDYGGVGSDNLKLLRCAQLQSNHDHPYDHQYTIQAGCHSFHIFNRVTKGTRLIHLTD